MAGEDAGGCRGGPAPRGRQWLKVLGIAGAVGVAASGALVARSERGRRAYTPDEIRDRLHDRYARVRAARDSGDARTADPTGGSDAR